MAAYLSWGAWYWLGRTASTIFFCPLEVGQEKMGGRVGLAWAACGVDAILTYWLVGEEGVSGSSKATLIALLPTLALAAWWTLRGGHLAAPTIRGWKGVWPLVKIRLQGEAPTLALCAWALQLNSWMGPALAAKWALCHLAADLVTGLGLASWGIGSKHLAYWTKAKNNPLRGQEAWSRGDRWGLVGITLVLCLGWGLLGPWAMGIGGSYAVKLRFEMKLKAPGTVSSEAQVRRGTWAWALTCVLGWGLLVLFASPSLGGPTMVYTMAAILSVGFMVRP